MSLGRGLNLREVSMREVRLWGPGRELGEVQVLWDWCPRGSDLLMPTVPWPSCELEMVKLFLGRELAVVRVLRGLYPG